jgi:hypothetical protein
MSEWVRAALDVILIGMVGAGLVQAVRLIKHLAGLQQGRIEMERFVHEFSATVFRAEAGIKGLKHMARESGDDLEKLVEKALLIRDELNFLVGSADQIAERLSNAASGAVKPHDKSMRTEASPEPVSPFAKEPTKSTAPVAPVVVKDSAPAAAAVASASTPATPPTSRAEKELLQALQKLS